jgi:hypothetical protein
MSKPRDVWVQDLTQHTPAHRIVHPQLYTDERHHPIYEIACPPGIMAGGQLISRAQAQTLMVHPCCKCFSLTPTAPGPGVRNGLR